MNEDLINIEWDNVDCHICNDSKNLEPIVMKGEPFVNGQFGYAVHPKICKSCGLTLLSPRWSKKDYDKFYRFHYDKLYRLETKPDYGNPAVLYNIKEIWGRIKKEKLKKISLQYFRCWVWIWIWIEILKRTTWIC